LNAPANVSARLLERFLFDPLARGFLRLLPEPLADARLMLLVKVASTSCAAWILFSQGAGGWVSASLWLLLGLLATHSERRRALTQKPNEGDIFWHLMRETLAPWHAIVCVVAMVLGSAGDLVLHGLAILFVLVYYLDWTVMRMLLKAEGAYRGLYQPRSGTTDERLLRIHAVAAKVRISSSLIGPDELLVIALVLGPAFDTPTAGLATACLLGTLGFIHRVRLEVALLKSRISVVVA
jgi:hypothetical protein